MESGRGGILSSSEEWDQVEELVEGTCESAEGGSQQAWR